jgi:hypothetical protein
MVLSKTATPCRVDSRPDCSRRDHGVTVQYCTLHWINVPPYWIIERPMPSWASLIVVSNSSPSPEVISQAHTHTQHSALETWDLREMRGRKKERKYHQHQLQGFDSFVIDIWSTFISSLAIRFKKRRQAGSSPPRLLDRRDMAISPHFFAVST